MKFDANVSTLFSDVPILDRFSLASQLGFDAVESWWPLDCDLGRWEDAIRESEVQLVLLNFFGGDLAAGDRGVLSDLERGHEFVENIPVALELADSLGCRALHAPVGKRKPFQPRSEQMAQAIDLVRRAADAAAQQGAWILIEPMNGYDNGPCLLEDVDGGLAFIAEVQRPNVGLQFDLYHLELTEGLGLAGASIPRIGSSLRHVQIADAPGRGAPGTGTIDFDAFFSQLEAVAYDGYVGLEYLGSGDRAGDLDWLPLKERARPGP